jgi:hypothetical protein
LLPAFSFLRLTAREWRQSHTFDLSTVVHGALTKH